MLLKESNCESLILRHPLIHIIQTCESRNIFTGAQIPQVLSLYTLTEQVNSKWIIKKKNKRENCQEEIGQRICNPRVQEREVRRRKICSRYVKSIHCEHSSNGRTLTKLEVLCTGWSEEYGKGVLSLG